METLGHVFGGYGREFHRQNCQKGEGNWLSRQVLSFGHEPSDSRSRFGVLQQILYNSVGCDRVYSPTLPIPKKKIHVILLHKG